MKKASPSRASRTANCRAAGPPCTTRARPLRTMCSSPAAGACWASPPWRIRCSTPWPTAYGAGRPDRLRGAAPPLGHRPEGACRAVSHREETFMVYRIYVEKRPELRGGGQGHFVRDPSSAAHQKRDGPAPAEPLRRGGHQPRSCLTQCCRHRVQRARSWTSTYDGAARRRGRGVRRGVPARPVRPARRLAPRECIQLISQGERPDGAAPPACILLYGAAQRGGAG